MMAYSDTTLRAMRKDDLIKIIRCLEHNNAVLHETINQQAYNFELLKNPIKQKLN